MGEVKTATCQVCGKTITYKTKKPRLCKACHEKRYGKRKIYHKKQIPTKSKGEFFMNAILNDLLPEAAYIDNGYYSFLISPKGYPMQLDRYYPRLHLAFEYDGEQHTKDVETFFKTQQAFEYQKQCDTLKETLCSEKNITVIRVSYKEFINKKLIVEKLKKSGTYGYICNHTTLNYTEE